MWGPAARLVSASGNVSDELQREMIKLGNEIREQVAVRARIAQIPEREVTMLVLTHLFILEDDENVHFAFANVPSGGMSTQVCAQDFGKGTFSPQEVVNFFAHSNGLLALEHLSFPSLILKLNPEARATDVGKLADDYIAHVKKGARLMAPSGYTHLQHLLDQFRVDHPAYDNNVFLIMRFQKAEHFGQIATAIESNLARHGLKCLRADQKTYPSDSDLWDNVCTYMMGCKYGIAVFEDIDERNFNPNISIEYGFMRAHDKKVLLLKERRLPRMPTDIVGKLYRDFDQMNIAVTITSVIDDWVTKDLHMK